MPVALAASHTVLVLLVGVAVWTSDDGETGLLWGVPYILDLPASLALVRAGDESWGVAGLLLFGGVRWAFIGAVFELVTGVYRSISRPQLNHG
jgi:hypothetical protein